jgi:hypothetical protein
VMMAVCFWCGDHISKQQDQTSFAYDSDVYASNSQAPDVRARVRVCVRACVCAEHEIV